MSDRTSSPVLAVLCVMAAVAVISLTGCEPPEYEVCHHGPGWRMECVESTETPADAAEPRPAASAGSHLQMSRRSRALIGAAAELHPLAQGGSARAGVDGVSPPPPARRGPA